MTKKDKIIELMYAIAKASFVSLFIFLLIAFLAISPLTPIALKSYIDTQFSPHTLSILVFGIFLLALALSYRGNKIRESLITIDERLEELYYEKIPFIIMGIGYSLLLAILLIVINFKYQSTMVVLGGLSFVLIIIGIFLLIMCLYAKKSLEGRVSFTLKRAFDILDKNGKADGMNPTDTKNLKRYIYLTYKNIKKEIGRLNLELPKKSDGIPDSELKYTFKYYLPCYIKFAKEEQLDSLKEKLRRMKDSLKDKDEKTDWKTLIQTLLDLKKEITTYLKDNKFNLTYQKSSRQSEWILENKDTIVKVIGFIVSIIFAITQVLPLVATTIKF